MPRARRTTLALATLLACLTSAPAQGAATGDAWVVDGDATITLTGRGYGHGHGMSQYGAQGAARQGLTWPEIVDFYYPGTAREPTRGLLRVLISADTDGDLTVQAAAGLGVRTVSDGTVRTLPARKGLTSWRLSGQGARTKVEFRRDNTWRVWRRFAGEVEFRSSVGPISLVLPGRTVAYRGRLRSSVPTAGGARQSVNVVSLQNYLRGVVPLEIPALWHPEAVSAQAVAARTYAARERFDNRSRNYHLCDTTMCQVYGGVPAEHPAATAAVVRTAGEGLWHEDKPAFTQFSASNGGHSAQGSQPYLVAQADPYDRWSGNPYRTWTTPFTDRTLERLWPQIGDLRRIVVRQRDGEGAWGGRVLTVRFVGAQGRVDVSGATLRSVLGLRSNYVTFSVAAR